MKIKDERWKPVTVLQCPGCLGIMNTKAEWDKHRTECVALVGIEHYKIRLKQVGTQFYVSASRQKLAPAAVKSCVGKVQFMADQEGIEAVTWVRRRKDIKDVIPLVRDKMAELIGEYIEALDGVQITAEMAEWNF